MKKIIFFIILIIFITPTQVFASNPKTVNEIISARKPEPAFWKKNRINLFYQKKDYRGLSNKYKNFSVGVIEIKDDRISGFYHKKDKFFQTSLIPTLQLLIKEELEHSQMFKEVKLVYEPYKGEIMPEKMDKIRKNYNVDMLIAVNLTDFQIIRGISGFHSQMLLEGNNVISPATLDGMDMNFKIGGIFQLIFLPLHYVLWSDTVKREYLKFAPKGRLKNKEEIEPIVQNLLSQVMTDMLYLMSEDGKFVKLK